MIEKLAKNIGNDVVYVMRQRGVKDPVKEGNDDKDIRHGHVDDQMMEGLSLVKFKNEYNDEHIANYSKCSHW